MALNPSGPISLGGATTGQSINLELGASGTATVSLNDSTVRTLAGVPSGQIIMPTNFWGKSYQANLTYTFSANTTQTVITISSLPGYIAGKTNLTVTINAGILVYSNDGTPALTITGGTAGDTVTVVNNGYIAGAGAGDGGAGGNAISLGYPATINNTSPVAYIGGGGGGGGSSQPAWGGGGAGGGAGGNGGTGGFTFPGVGGSGGAAPFGGSAAGTPGGAGGGGAGYSRAGSGHNPICTYTTPPLDYGGGGGGGWGASGGRATTSSRNGAAGGSGNAAGSSASPANGTPGGAGGKAVALNGNSVTWTAGDTTRVYGSVS